MQDSFSTAPLTQPKYGLKSSIGRRSVEKLDLLMLALEAIDINAQEAFSYESKRLDLGDLFPTYIDIWKSRCHNPMRRVARNSAMPSHSFNGLILLLSHMATRFYPRIRELLSSKGEPNSHDRKWILFTSRFDELISERMNLGREAVKNYFSHENSTSFYRELLIILALSSGPGGHDRLLSSVFDPLTIYN